MRKLKTFIVVAVLGAFTAIAAAPHASAMTCAPDLEDACRTAAFVICKVVAKGQPCLA
jgi:hypothetical protein